MIAQSLDEIENLGVHPMLTDVSVLLSDAQRKLAEWRDAGRPGAARESAPDGLVRAGRIPAYHVRAKRTGLSSAPPE